MKYFVQLLLVSVVISSCSGDQANTEDKNKVTVVPEAQAVVFMPGIVSTGMYTRDIAMTPDGKEIYFCVSLSNYTWSTILVTRKKNGKWTSPEVMEHMDDPRFMNIEPSISPDGRKFYFASNRSRLGDENPEKDTDLWVMDRGEKGWGEPYNPGPPLNTDASEFFPSVVNDGSIYFTLEDPATGINQICYSRMSNGKFEKPLVLPPRINAGRNRFNAYADPAERFIIIPVIGHEDTFGSTDYYISFRNSDGTWREPVNMGSKINTAGGLEYSPYVSPDGKYFYFMSVRPPEQENIPEELTYKTLRKIHDNPGNGNPSVYRIDADIIDELSRISQKMEEFAFVTYVSDSLQERAASRLIRSIRERAGIYRKCMIYVVLGDHKNYPCKSLTGPGIKLLPIEISQKYYSYPLVYKAFACAMVEQLAGAGIKTLAWFDPSSLVLKEPSALDLSDDKDAAVRPVTLVNTIGESPHSSPGAYWQRIYELLRVDYKNVPVLRTIADETEVRAYYNCEIFSFDPSAGICSRWKEVLIKLLDDKIFQSKACVSPLQKLFLHQAVLSAVLSAEKTLQNIRDLPLSHSYPFNQHSMLADSVKAGSMDEITCLILDYINEKDKNWLSGFTISDSLSEWVSGM
jgi:hypothetical protein